MGRLGLGSLSLRRLLLRGHCLGVRTDRASVCALFLAGTDARPKTIAEELDRFWTAVGHYGALESFNPARQLAAAGAGGLARRPLAHRVVGASSGRGFGLRRSSRTLDRAELQGDAHHLPHARWLLAGVLGRQRWRQLGV